MRNSIVIAILTVLLCSASLIAQPDCTSLQKYPLRFAILGDRTGDHQEGIYPAVVAEITRMRPDFVMTVGDMIEGYTSDTAQMQTEWDEYFEIVSTLPCPIYYTPGNHDITSDNMEPTYQQRIGKPYYSFDQRGLHFVILDNSRAESFEEIKKEQLDWLKKDLEANRSACHTMVFMHKPFWYRTIGADKPDPLHEIFKQFGVDAVFTGHFHTYFSGEYDGILYTSLGSSGGGADEIPEGLLYHFGWVTVDGDGIHIAPIKKDAVLPWDIQPVKELRVANKIKSDAVIFASPLKVDDELKVVNNTVTVAIDGGQPGLVYKNVLTWDLPDGWKVEPEEFPYTIDCVSSVSMQFTVTPPDNLFPLPYLKTKLPYSPDKVVSVSKPLELTRTVICNHADDGIIIDGELKESAWENPCTVLFENNGTPSKQDKSEIYLAYDDNNLYLAAKCYDSEIESLKAEMTARDADVFLEDAVGFMLWPNGEGKDAYQIYINPVGTIYDQHLEQQTDGYWIGLAEWSGDFMVKTKRTDDYYSIEVQVPLDQINAEINPDESWRVNFRRKQFRSATAAAFQPPWSYNPNTFGELKFE